MARRTLPPIWVPLTKVVSGGQTGADQGGLFGAAAARIPTGGWAPRGWRTEAGPAPWLAAFGLQEHTEAGYPPRTMANVDLADGVLLVGKDTSHGSRLTATYACRTRKPVRAVPYAPGDPPPGHALVRELYSWCREHGVFVLDVAGNREESNRGICLFTLALVQALCTRPPQVWNLRNGPAPEGAVYAGRPSPWGNPFGPGDTHTAPPGATREGVLVQYGQWLFAPEQAPFRAQVVTSLAGKDAACWCAPLPCHVDLLLYVANQQGPQTWEAAQQAVWPTLFGCLPSGA